MPHAEARFRHEFAQAVGQAVDAVDPVVDDVDLTAALQLAEDDLADQFVVGSGDEGADRQAGLRRGVDDADVADPGEGHVERARDRRGRHRHHVDLGAELLEELLLADPEALLLVDHDQPEVLEAHVPLDEPVGADDDVDPPFAQAPDDVALLGLGAESRKHLHPHREGGQPLREGREVLKGQHSRRNQHGDLLAIVDRLERGAQGDLRLAEADVAADQAVHRLRRFQIALDLVDRPVLVVRFGVGERLRELPVPGGVFRKGGPVRSFAGGVELDELEGHLADRPPDALFGLDPLAGAEFGRDPARRPPPL
jgi:hypothetical protein